MYGNVWEYMEICVNSREFVENPWNLWEFVEICGNSWELMLIPGNL